MKKVMLIFLVLVLVFSSNFTAVVNADSSKDVFILKYEEIEDRIFEYNLTIQTNKISLDSVNKSLKDLKDVKSGAESDITKQIALIDMQIEYYQHQLALLQPILIPGGLQDNKGGETGFPTGEGGENEFPPSEDSKNETGNAGSSGAENDPALYAAVNSSIAYISNAYLVEMLSLEERKDALQSSKNLSNSEIESKELTLNNSINQLTKANYQMVKEAQSLFLLYHSLDFDYKDMELQLQLRESEMEFTKLKRNLGMARDEEVEAIETAIEDLNTAIDNIADQKKDILGQLNYLMGWEQDKPLRLGQAPKLAHKEVVIDYDDDLIQVKDNSYSWLTEQNDYELKNLAFEDAKKNYDSSSDERKEAKLDLQKALISLNNMEKDLKKNFESLYDDLIDKQEALDLEEEDLLEANEDYRLAKLKYNLGMISELEKENAKMQYEKQEVELKRARHNLKRAYLEYQWIKEGLS